MQHLLDKCDLLTENRATCREIIAGARILKESAVLDVMEKIEDQELIRLCRKGKMDGFSILYQRYSKAVFNSILRIVGDFGTAEDLLQEVFVTIYQEIMKSKDIQHFGGWSKRIGVNRAISYLRQQKRVLAFEAVGEDVLESMPDEGDETELRVDHVKWAISQLPDGFRTIVNLYLFENMPQEEIAGMLGISHATVRTQYHRAKKKILSLLQKGVVE